MKRSSLSFCERVSVSLISLLFIWSFSFAFAPLFSTTWLTISGRKFLLQPGERTKETRTIAPTNGTRDFLVVGRRCQLPFLCLTVPSRHHHSEKTHRTPLFFLPRLEKKYLIHLQPRGMLWKLRHANNESYAVGILCCVTSFPFLSTSFSHGNVLQFFGVIASPLRVFSVSSSSQKERNFSPYALKLSQPRIRRRFISRFSIHYENHNRPLIIISFFSLSFRWVFALNNPFKRKWMIMSRKLRTFSAHSDTRTRSCA